MPALPRFLFFVIVIVVVLGGIIFAFNILGRSNQTALLTINSSGKFSANEKKISNNQKFRIKNDNKVNQTVKLEGSNETIAEIEAKTFSKEISLKKDSKNVLYLASDNKQKTTVIVGSPKASSGSTTDTTEAPEATNKPVRGSVTAPSEPLPDTGPGDIYLFSLSAFFGYGLYKFSNFFWKKVVK